MKLSILSLSLILRFLCFSSYYHQTNSFSIPTTATSNAIRGLPARNTFAATVSGTASQWNRQTCSVHMTPVDIDLAHFSNSMATSSFHLCAVEVFDGSSIVDPVVVSGNFWSSLQRQIVSALLGQFIASVAFAILASLLAPQLSALRDVVVSKFTNENNNEAPAKKFIKADSIVRPEPDFGKLFICLLIDIVGTSSEALPIVGEFTDVLTAPAAALALQNLFPGSSKFVFLFEFAEEILPLTDFIPFATICWVIDTYYPESSIADVFQLGTSRGGAVTAAEKAESFDTIGDAMNEADKRNSNMR
mmetsp:Transcript_5697/g.14224  ORF Transcript_5697/g.14224 Transcript_5697/m.14224 type:complete len:304 (+) Transcript_5697:71-982(+)